MESLIIFWLCVGFGIFLFVSYAKTNIADNPNTSNFCIKELHGAYYVYQQYRCFIFTKWINTEYHYNDLEACFEKIEKLKAEFEKEQAKPRTIYKTKRNKRK